MMGLKYLGDGFAFRRSVQAKLFTGLDN